DHAGLDEESSVSSLFGAVSTDAGQTWSASRRLADSVCACCRPVALAGDRGDLAIAYRRGARDLRDPALAVSFDGGRSFALDTVVSADRWQLAACPDQGPGLTWNRAGGGHYAWYTAAGEPGIYVIPW